jgi:hypothetical protein
VIHFFLSSRRSKSLFRASNYTLRSRGTQFGPARVDFRKAFALRFRSAASFGSPSRVAFFSALFAAISLRLTGCENSPGITAHI